MKKHFILPFFASILLLALLSLYSCDNVAPGIEESENIVTETSGTETSGTEMSGTETSDTEMSDTEKSDTEKSDTETSDTETSDTETSGTETSGIETSDTEISDTETSDSEKSDSEKSDTEKSDTETSDIETSDTETSYTETDKTENVPPQNTYTVIWKNHDGTVLETDENVVFGTTPSYNGTTPQRETTAEFTYTFMGWILDVSSESGEITYIAQFTSTTNVYTVIWKNYDGTVLETDEDVAYGTTPSYNSDTPQKAATAEFSYTFIGWTPDISAVNGNITYTAQYTSTTNAYTVIWENYDGAVLETDEDVLFGTTPSYNGTTPQRGTTAEFTYTFAGWTPDINAVNGNITYTAQYTSTTNVYTVIWENYDGTVLETDEDVAYGTIPSYNGDTPQKAATAEFSYTFIEWTPDISAVNGNVTYTARYIPITNAYTVIWKNYDGTVLETDEDVSFGTTPSYNGATPQRETSAEFYYTFIGWTPDISAVNGDVTYTAKFQEQSLFAFSETGVGYSVDAYYGNSTKVIFPSQYNGKDIVEIGSGVLYNNDKVLEVVLPDTVTKIGNLSFSNCSKLYKINIPAECQYIGDYVMMNTNVEEITLPASISTIGYKWLYKSPIKTLRFEGNPNQFVGNYFGVVSGTISLSTSSGNYLEDHFNRTTEESKETVNVGVGYLPKYYYNRWTLKSNNRWFNATVDGEQIRVFANGNNSNYTYTEILERTEKKDGGRKVYWYTYTYMRGAFALLPTTLTTIEISRNSEVNTSVLIGYASHLTISYYD